MSGWDDYFSAQNTYDAQTTQPEQQTATTVSARRNTLIEKLKERQTNRYEKKPISLLQSNPNNPLSSAKYFDDIPLRPELRRALTSMDYIRPSKVQGSALPVILRDPPTSLIAQSQSGTGKTATFAMGMLNRVDLSRKCVQCLCVTPTYELAIQVGQVIEQLGQHMENLSIHYAIRDAHFSKGSQIRDHVVVGTPGKLLNLMNVACVLNFDNLKVFVLDEADIIIDQGENTRAVDIYSFVPSTCQMLLFSATYSDSVIALGKRMARNAEIIRLAKPEMSLDNIEQFYVQCAGDQEKKDAIDCIYQNMGIDKAIVFCNTIAQSNMLFEFFVGQGYKVVVINSSYDVKRRADELMKFKMDAHVLISTNVTARGLDIGGVRIVINFDVPVRADYSPDYETYLHRIGRSGRFGDMGFAFTFVSSESDVALVRKIGVYFEKTIKELKGGDSEAIISMVENDGW